MDQKHYAKLINEELEKLPFYVKEFYLAKNLALTTKYQYLTENFIEEHFEYINAHSLLKYQYLSKEFILKHKDKVKFDELFDFYSKDYLVVTFLSILNMAKNKELYIEQTNNFDELFISARKWYDKGNIRRFIIY